MAKLTTSPVVRCQKLAKKSRGLSTTATAISGESRARKNFVICHSVMARLVHRLMPCHWRKDGFDLGHLGFHLFGHDFDNGLDDPVAKNAIGFGTIETVITF